MTRKGFSPPVVVRRTALAADPAVAADPDAAPALAVVGSGRT